MKKILLLGVLLITLTSCGIQKSNNNPTESQNDTTVNTKAISVSSSIVPIASVVKTIGGDFIESDVIVPAGVSPHGFDLSAKQMTELSKDELVFMVGLEHIDGFLEKAVDRKKQIHLAEGIELLETTGHDHNDHEGEEESHEDHDDHSDEHEDEHENHEGEEHHDNEEDEHGHNKDPHVWLGKENIISIAQKVRDELSRILPEQAVYFTENTDNFIVELETAYSDFNRVVEGKNPKEFIVFHDAYNYLMESVELENNLKIPFSENVLHESGTAHMKELIEEVELHGLKYAFTEPQFKSGNLESFANKYNLTIAILDPLGTNSEVGGYIETLTSNLENLSKIYE